MKNIIKKFTACVLMTVMAVSLTACGGGGNTDVPTPPKEEYTEIYVLESVERQPDAFTEETVIFYGEEMYQLGLIDNYIAFKDETSGTLYYLNNEFDFTVADGVINAGGARIPMEKAELSVVLNMGERIFTYTITDHVDFTETGAPAPGLYALNYISTDSYLKDRGRIDVEKDNAGTYLEIFRDNTGKMVLPDAEADFTITDTELDFGDGTMAYKYIDDMLVLYSKTRVTDVVNTYILSDEIPSKIAVKGHYAINTITEDGIVYDMDTLKTLGLDNTALDVTGTISATFTYGDVVLDLNIIGNVMAFSDMNTMYRFAGDTLTCEINGMTFEFIYQG